MASARDSPKPSLQRLRAPKGASSSDAVDRASWTLGSRLSKCSRSWVGPRTKQEPRATAAMVGLPNPGEPRVEQNLTSFSRVLRHFEWETPSDLYTTNQRDQTSKQITLTPHSQVTCQPGREPPLSSETGRLRRRSGGAAGTTAPGTQTAPVRRSAVASRSL